MRKISKIRSSNLDRNATDTDLRETRPLRIPGATITSWPGSADINLDLLFAKPVPGTTIAGAVSAGVTPTAGLADGRPNRGTVSLSDGTRITFVTASQFDSVELV
jgi:hypothetical protein